MTINKTLIVFGTRKGTTTETVQVIAEILRADFNHEVVVCESRQIKACKKQLNEYQNIIIGSSIAAGCWKSQTLKFAKSKVLKGKRVAVFVTAGGTLNKVQKYGATKSEATREAIQKYIDKYLKKFKFDPISKTAFGGKVIKKGVTKYNSWDKSDIVAWTKDLAAGLMQI